MADMLVPTEDAQRWVDTMSLQAGRDAHLGRQEDFRNNPAAFNAVGNVGKAVVEAIDLSKRLAVDESRTVASRHEAAEKAVSKKVEVIAEGQRILQTEATKSLDQADALVRSTFSVEGGGDFMFYMLHGQIKEWAQNAERGLPMLRDAIASDIDVAKVLYTSKPYLLSLAPDVLASLKKSAVRAHAPDAQTLYDNARVLGETAARYPQAIASMKASLYNRAVADRARSTRVDV